MTVCESCPARRGTICAALGTDARASLRALAREERVPRGQWIVRPGAPASQVFILREGYANVARATRDGKRQVLAFLFPGDFFGLSAETHYVYGVHADSDVLICRLDRGAFESLVERTPGLDRRLRMQLTRLLDSALELAFTLGRKTALERVASFVWYLSYRQRKLGRSSRTVEIPMSRADIADFLGLTSESVSRALTRLRHQGLVRMPTPGAVEIPDLARLREAGVVFAEPVAD